MRWGLTWMLCALLVTAPIAAQPATPAGPPRFEIETITVEGAEKISPDILVSESLLDPGSSYTESELRDARYRIVRLPFVLDAEFSLRKGSQRGLYELVVSVKETRRWFFGVDQEVTVWAQPISFEDLATDEVSSASGGLSGRRFSVGRHGVFFVALGGDDGSLHFGFTQYNLLDRSILLGLGYSVSDCSPQDVSEGERSGTCRTDLYQLGLDPTFSTWSADEVSHAFRLDLGVPIQGNRSVRFSGSYRRTDGGFRRQAYEPRAFAFFDFKDREELRADLAWVYNSIDDPVFPTKGRILEAGLSFAGLRADLQSAAQPGVLRPDLLTSMSSGELGFKFAGTRYWPVTRSQTLSANLQLFLGRSDFENVADEGRRLLTGQADVARASFTAGHAKLLKRTRVGSRWRELRWESDAELLFDRTSPDFAQRENPIGGYRIGTGISFRNTWGLFRLKLSYRDLEGR